MLPCLLIGDSIAVGVAQQRPECAVIAKVGISTRDWNRRYLQVLPQAQTTVISLGVNDGPQAPTAAELRELRMRITGRVVWILPSTEKQPAARWAALWYARYYGDQVVELPADRMAPDGIHPTGTGYRILAGQTRQASS